MDGETEIFQKYMDEVLPGWTELSENTRDEIRAAWDKCRTLEQIQQATFSQALRSTIINYSTDIGKAKARLEVANSNLKFSIEKAAKELKEETQKDAGTTRRVHK